MNKIGLPHDNMLFVNAGRIKALILEEKALDVLERGIEHYIHGSLHSIHSMYNIFLKYCCLYFFFILT
jgi:hypothetical protein